MNTHLLSIFLLLPFFSTAQNNWDAFPQNQKTWWKSGDTLQLYYNDSTEVLPNFERRYFGMHYIAGPYGECFLDLVANDQAFQDRIPETFFQHYIVENAQWKNEDNQLLFQADAQPGDFWSITVSNNATYDAIKITCDVQDTMSILGVTTATRHFTIHPLLVGQPVNNTLSGFEIIQTEAFGLTKFIPFHALASGKIGPMYEILGVEQNGNVFGIPMTEDFFLGHYSPGDVYKWHDYTENYFDDTKVERWILDTLTAVNLNINYIELISDREELKIIRKTINGITTSDSASIHSVYARYVNRQYMQTILNATPNWYSPEVPFVNTTWDLSGVLDTMNNLTLMGSNSYYFSPDVCMLGQITDQFDLYSLHSFCGYSGHSFPALLAGDMKYYWVAKTTKGLLVM
ncbi:MAG: hypothetical protein IPL65_03850 [Lewinellaceae bacterium]|nr:hypothetical protein [Lewinellaceae bacterium]